MSARHCTQSERERLPAQPRALSATRGPHVLRFAPRDVFAFVRRAFNDFGTIVSRIDIVRATDSGWPKVECVLQAVDAVEACTDPANTDYLRHVHNRLGTGEPLLRRGLAP